MKSQKKSNLNNSSEKENKELEKMNKELKDFIEQNESLKIGITKIFEEIEKNNTSK